MGKVACAVAIENLVIDTQGLEQVREDDAAYGVDGIDTDAELALLDGLEVGELQTQHGVDVALVVRIVDDDLAEMIDVGIVEILTLGNGKHFGTIGSRKKLSLAVEQLQGIPLTGVMRGGDDDTAIGT